MNTKKNKKCQCGREIVRGTPVCLSAPDVCRVCWLENQKLHMRVHPNGCEIYRGSDVSIRETHGGGIVVRI